MLMSRLVGLTNELPWLIKSLPKYIRGDGFERIVLSGSARKVLLLPGLFEGYKISQVFARVLHQMGFIVVVPDFFKYGIRNCGDINEYTKRVVDLMERLINEENWDDVVVIGYSKGGFSAVQLLRFFPLNIKRVFIISTPVNGNAWCNLLSWILPVKSIRQMRRGAGFIREFRQKITPEILNKIKVVTSNRDYVVSVREARLIGAENIIMSMTHGQFYVDEAVPAKIGVLALTT